jgi:hypothetical protein
MRLFAIEYLADRLACVGRQSRNEDQGFDPSVGACTYHGPGIGMRDKHDRTIGPLQRALKCRDIIRQRR